MLIAAQALAPATVWGQATRAAAPAAPVPAAKGPAPASAAAAAASAPKGAALDRRLALVVGNNTYPNAPLVNPINDARLVAKTLEGLGFEVMLRENLNLRDFKATMRQFASRLENEEGTALLYYAGHGVQIEGRNFLLPIDVGTGDEYELRDSAVDLEDTLMSRLVRARKRERIIILDACRDNPFRAPNQQHRALLMRGFAQMGSEKGSLIVYSTNPGNTAEDGSGKNSIFTEFLAREIQKEGIEVGQALRAVAAGVNEATKGRQVPWVNTSLLGEFYFRPVDQRLEEERRKKEVQAQVEAALKAAREDLKRDEAARISAAVAEREREREREKQDRERQYNAQLAEMKALLERRDKDLESARMQVAMAAKNRDEQLTVLATVEAERRQLERERAAVAATSRTPAPAPAGQPAGAGASRPADDAAKRQADDAARKQADDAARREAEKAAEAERAARERRDREAREERERLLKAEAQRQAAADKAQRDEAERQAKAAAEIARRDAAAKTQREQEERDRLVQAETRRKAAEQARREESERQAKAAADRIRALEEEARQAAARDRLAREAAASRDAALQGQRDQNERERLANERAKRAKEDAERLTREAETRERLAKIEEEVRRKAALEYDMLNRKATLPPELAALMVNEVQKTTVAGTNGDFMVRGVRLPANLAVRPAAPNVPANCAAFLGAWGNGRWNGERTAEIWIEGVEADCRARAIYARGGLGKSGEAATYVRGDARISGDRLTLDLGPVRIELTREGERAAGRWSSGVNIATASFVRIPAVPERTVTLFANEAADFGARPSRVISANQINVNERTQIGTMLPMPTTVPGIDTLTTVQLEAFLKAHPDTVLLDAFVGEAHKTLPGAYWLPELGSVTVGQKELNQIEATLRAANGGDPTRPIVVFERSSTYGWFGYHGVLRLLGMGYKNIYWYRGGLDAWHDAQFPLAQAEAWAKAR